ncbi:MnhB domain-containing protein [Saliphagus sp. LR7]|uniref:MnhB domain-containing protein n=1 Tax=Saliphagus sp. LR7 TaxID=2282654 RepID=UPI000DF786C2|nr:MnhB domain-containing protein [Saliphagus sp. LR7]
MSSRRPYVESPVIMATVRLVAPFVLTYGIFVTLHGASSPGGGFQGGVIAAAVIVMLSFAYGIDLTWEWIDKRVLVGLVGGGVALFGAIALGAVLFGGQFLEVGVYPIPEPDKYGIELVEVGIGMTVAGVVTSLFFTLARGAMPPVGEDGESGRDDEGTAATDGGTFSSEAPGSEGTGGDRPVRDGPDAPEGGDRA